LHQVQRRTHLGRSIGGAENPPDLTVENASSDFIRVSPVDGIERLVSHRQVATYPLAAMVGLDLDAVLAPAADPWSLTSLREKLIKIGAKVVNHGRYVTFQMAEVAVPRQMFADILALIAQLRAPPRRHEETTSANATSGNAGGVPRDVGKAARCSGSAPSYPALLPLQRRWARFSIAQTRPMGRIFAPKSPGIRWMSVNRRPLVNFRSVRL